MTDAPIINEPVRTKSKGLPLIAKVAIGCFGFLILLSILMTLVLNVLFSKVTSLAPNLIKQGIEAKTGMKIDGDATTGEGMTITDSKTGGKISVGNQEIPADFPKDFPIYPGAKATGSLSGMNKEVDKGYYIIMTTPDELANLKTFYDTNLKKNGWIVESSMTLGEMYTYTVKKGTYTGSVSVTRGDKDKESSIIISLESGSKNSGTTSAPNMNAEPTEEPLPPESGSNDGSL